MRKPWELRTEGPKVSMVLHEELSLSCLPHVSRSIILKAHGINRGILLAVGQIWGFTSLFGFNEKVDVNLPATGTADGQLRR